jgi:hypothetical protein
MFTPPLHSKALTNPVVVSVEPVHCSPFLRQAILLAVPVLSICLPQLGHHLVLPQVTVEANILLLVIEVSHQVLHPLHPIGEVTFMFNLLQETCCGNRNCYWL